MYPSSFSLPQLSGDSSNLRQLCVISSGSALNYWEPLCSTRQPHFSYSVSFLSTFHHQHIIVTQFTADFSHEVMCGLDKR